MNAAALLSGLRCQGVEFVAAGNKLRFRPADRVSKADRDAIRAHKAELLALLAGESTSADVTVGSVVGTCSACGQPLRLRKRYRLDPSRCLAWCDNDQCGRAELVDARGVS